jgi:phosphate transport system protein
MVSNFQEDSNKIKSDVKSLADGLIKANELLLEALEDCDSTKFNDAKAYIKNVGKKTSDIDNSIIKFLALYTPEARDLRQAVAYLKITNELLRATTSTRSFIKGFTDVCSDVDIKTINEYAIPMQRATVNAVKNTMAMIEIDCIDELQETYNYVLIEESKSDDLYEMVEKSLVQQADQSSEFEKFHHMLRALRRSEKIADRASSIASLLLYAKVGGEI